MELGEESWLGPASWATVDLPATLWASVSPGAWESGCGQWSQAGSWQMADMTSPRH